MKFHFSDDIERYFEIMGVKNKNINLLKCIKYFFHPRLMPVGIFRLASFFYRKEYFALAKFFTFLNLFIFGMEISPRVQIGGGFFVPHSVGIVIGASSIGRCATIYQGVTLGASFLDMDFNSKSRPILGDHVLIGAGAKVIGGVRIGDNVKVGANALVIRDVPSNSKVLSPEGRVIQA